MSGLERAPFPSYLYPGNGSVVMDPRLEARVPWDLNAVESTTLLTGETAVLSWDRNPELPSNIAASPPTYPIALHPLLVDPTRPHAMQRGAIDLYYEGAQVAGACSITEKRWNYTTHAWDDGSPAATLTCYASEIGAPDDYSLLRHWLLPTVDWARALPFLPFEITLADLYSTQPTLGYTSFPLSDLRLSGASDAAPVLVSARMFGTAQRLRDAARWKASTAYAVGAKVRGSNESWAYVCTTAGTSASSGGPSGTGTGIHDGSVVWNYDGTVPWMPLSRSLKMAERSLWLFFDSPIKPGPDWGNAATTTFPLSASTAGLTAQKWIYDARFPNMVRVVCSYGGGQPFLFQASAAAWAQATAYAVGDVVRGADALYTYTCTTAGTSSGSGTGPSGSGTGIHDGTVVWTGSVNSITLTSSLWIVADNATDSHFAAPTTINVQWSGEGVRLFHRPMPGYGGAADFGGQWAPHNRYPVTALSSAPVFATIPAQRRVFDYVLNTWGSATMAPVDPPVGGSVTPPPTGDTFTTRAAAIQPLTHAINAGRGPYNCWWTGKSWAVRAIVVNRIDVEHDADILCDIPGGAGIKLSATLPDGYTLDLPTTGTVYNYRTKRACAFSTLPALAAKNGLSLPTWSPEFGGGTGWNIFTAAQLSATAPTDAPYLDSDEDPTVMAHNAGWIFRRAYYPDDDEAVPTGFDGFFGDDCDWQLNDELLIEVSHYPYRDASGIHPIIWQPRVSDMALANVAAGVLCIDNDASAMPTGEGWALLRPQTATRRVPFSALNVLGPTAQMSWFGGSPPAGIDWVVKVYETEDDPNAPVPIVLAADAMTEIPSGSGLYYTTAPPPIPASWTLKHTATGTNNAYDMGEDEFGVHTWGVYFGMQLSNLALEVKRPAVFITYATTEVSWWGYLTGNAMSAGIGQEKVPYPVALHNLTDVATVAAPKLLPGNDHIIIP